MFSKTFALFLLTASASFYGLFCPINFYFWATLLLLVFFAFVLGKESGLLACIFTIIFSLTAVASAEFKTGFDLTQKTIPSFSSEPLFDATVLESTQTLQGNVRARIAVNAFKVGETWKKSTLTLQLYLKEGAAKTTLIPGQHIRLQGKVKPLERALLPGNFDPYYYGLSQNIHGNISLYHPFSILVVSTPASSFSSLFSNWQQQIKNIALTHLSPRSAGVLLALMIGDTTLFDEEQKAIYRHVGAGHLLAVSGLQVSILAVFLFGVFRFVFALIPFTGRRSMARTIASWFALILIWLFVGICGAPPSAMRAAIMASSLFIGFFIRREIRTLDALGLAGFVSLLIWPNAILDAGFLLSYAALFGLILATNFKTKFLKLATSTLSASFAAGLMTMPIAALLFGQVVPTSVFANMILVPLASALQLPAVLLGFAGILLQSNLLIQWAANCAASIEALCLMVGNYLGGIHQVEVSSTLAFILLMAVLCLLIQIFNRQSFKPAIAAMACLSFAGFMYNHELSGLRITFIPIGQGDATLISFPNGQTMLIDGGGNHNESFNPGEKIILPLLARRNIKKIDYLVLSHPDPDHLLGLLPVLEALPVSELWHSGFSEKHSLMKRLLKLAHKKKVEVLHNRELLGTHSIGNSIVQVLAPNPRTEGSLYDELSANDNSLVLRILHDNKSLLLPGDLEKWGERLLLRDNFNLKSNIVKAPHHGSRTSSTDAFVNAVSPEHVIFTTGRQNRYGFPHFQIVKKWHAVGANIWNTAAHGEINIWLHDNKLTIRSFL